MRKVSKQRREQRLRLGRALLALDRLAVRGVGSEITCAGEIVAAARAVAAWLVTDKEREQLGRELRRALYIAEVQRPEVGRTLLTDDERDQWRAERVAANMAGAPEEDRISMAQLVGLEPSLRVRSLPLGRVERHAPAPTSGPALCSSCGAIVRDQSATCATCAGAPGLSDAGRELLELPPQEWRRRAVLEGASDAALYYLAARERVAVPAAYRAGEGLDIDERARILCDLIGDVPPFDAPGPGDEVCYTSPAWGACRGRVISGPLFTAANKRDRPAWLLLVQDGHCEGGREYVPLSALVPDGPRVSRRAASPPAGEPAEPPRPERALTSALSVPCSTCDAPIGETCMTAAGRVAASFHAARRALYGAEPAQRAPALAAPLALVGPIALECPTCGAVPGDECRTGSGRRAVRTHSARVEMHDNGDKRAALAQRCPHCGAAVGMRCRTSTEKTMSAPHVHRRALARLAAVEAGRGSGRVVAVVACSKSKALSVDNDSEPQSCPARDLYSGALFRLAKHEIEGRASVGAWFILSALHGLVRPDDELRPYDVQLRPGPARGAWGEKVARALLESGELQKGDTLEIHAGKDYTPPALLTALDDAGIRVKVIGKRLSYGERRANYGRRARAFGLEPLEHSG